MPKSTTVPVPALPVLENPRVFPYPCGTLSLVEPGEPLEVAEQIAVMIDQLLFPDLVAKSLQQDHQQDGV